MPFPRSSGILLHPTSFPSRFGIGDLGNEATNFIDFLEEASQQYWQVLPLGPTGYGNSPYMCYSAMAGNPYLISLDKLHEQQLLADWDFGNLPDFSTHKVDFNDVIAYKTNLLKLACHNFKNQATPKQRQDFEYFCEAKAYWLDDYALFMALKEAHEGASWYTWEPGYAKRKPDSIATARKELEDLIFYQKFVQFQFFYQWSQLKTYANERGIEIIGDIPIYVAHDSADVWGNPEIFCLDEKGKTELMAGVPPDYFSATGQLWGNPVYNWKELEKQDFAWWIRRFQVMLDYVDIIRIDHFRGFEAFWAVPQGEETAENGEWVKAPGEALFKTVAQKLGKLPVLAEDLGVITPEVEALRDQFQFPGMKILQFAFGSDPGNPFLPFNYTRNSVVYTGSHDNDTTEGWFAKASDWEKDKLRMYLGNINHDGVHWDFIRLALSSVSNQAIIQLQDVIGCDGDARMNFPGKPEGNWEWRYHDHDLKPELAAKLKDLTILYGRAPIEKVKS